MSEEISTQLFENKINSILDKENKKEEYYDILKFFLCIFLKCIKWESDHLMYYVAFLTRRCNVLLELFWKNILCYLRNGVSNETPQTIKQIIQELNKYKTTQESVDKICTRIYESHFITDTALLTMSHDLAKYYYQHGKEKNCFPKLIIVDELLIHGRSLNKVLYHLEKNLAYSYSLYESEISFEQVKQRISILLQENVSIYIYAHNTGRNLLMDKYNKLVDRSIGKLLSTGKWRGLSRFFSDLISDFPVSNVAYSWSFCCKKVDNVFYSGRDYGHFRCISTEPLTKNENNFIWLYPNENLPKAVCTVRTKSNTVGGEVKEYSRMFIPYIIFDHLSTDKIWNLHLKICMDVKKSRCKFLVDFLTRYDGQIDEKMWENTEAYYKWICQTNELILNALLIREFWKATKDVYEYSWNDENINYNQLVRNFLSFSSEPIRKNEETNRALKEVGMWLKDAPEQCFDEYMKFLLDGIKPFSENHLFFYSPGKTRTPKYFRANPTKIYCQWNRKCNFRDWICGGMPCF